MSFNRSFNSAEVARLKQLVNEGCQVTEEIDILKQGLSETVKAVAEEMDMPVSVLKKAITVAHKVSYFDEAEKWDAIDTILDVVGKKG